MFKLQHQFNNIVETTELTNNQMTEFHCQCEWLKCPPPALLEDESGGQPAIVLKNDN